MFFNAIRCPKFIINSICATKTFGLNPFTNLYFFYFSNKTFMLSNDKLSILMSIGQLTSLGIFYLLLFVRMP